MSDTVSVVTSGTVPLAYKCESCGAPMLYRVDRSGKPEFMFCAALTERKLALALLPVPLAGGLEER